MPEIQTVDWASLDRFIADLVEAGFRPIGATGRTFEGPLHPSLADETRATTMQIQIRDGWPFVHPPVIVRGLQPSVHLNGNVPCLWRLGDDSLAWLRLELLYERIAQWAERYRGRATADDPVLDPELYWLPYNPSILATVDLREVPYGNGGSGDLRAERDEVTLKIGPEGSLRVRWYGRDDMPHPPANLQMIEAALKPDQAANLREELARVGRTGGPDVIMVVWDTPAGEPNALVLGVSRERRWAPLIAEAYEVARVDQDVLIRRAGPDATELLDKSVAVFGQGAVGSHVSLWLGSSGVGRMELLDSQKLRPGDIVRHAAPAGGIGLPKAVVMSLVTRERAPWVTANWSGSSWLPDEIRPYVDGRHLVIDAVGEESFTNLVSRLADRAGVPLLSIALYRGGLVARTRVWIPGGVPIHERTPDLGFRIIPPGPLEPTVTWETGCAAPINNAPPASVASAAAMAVRIAVEMLTGRETVSTDLVEVYRPLPGEVPFDVVGTLRFEA